MKIKMLAAGLLLLSGCNALFGDASSIPGKVVVYEDKARNVVCYILSGGHEYSISCVRLTEAAR